MAQVYHDRTGPASLSPADREHSTLPRIAFTKKPTTSQNIERLLAAGRRKCAIQRQAILGVEDYRTRADILLHVLERRCFGDRDDARLSDDPGECDLGTSHSVALSDFGQ